MSPISATDFLLKTLKDFTSRWTPSLPWAVGYSGGRDSGVLLWALSQIVPQGQLWALHVDHGWRSPQERAAEAELVAQWAAQVGVAVESYPPPPGGTQDEASARAHRYQCFHRFLERHPESPVFLAHHADDQAETVLMRLLQGRSWQGLGGMTARRGPFLRPLLGLRASVLADVAREQNVPFHQDSTNQDLRLARNHLRSVLPSLVERYPRAIEALGDFAAVWAQVAPQTSVHPGWRLEAGGGEVPAGLWDAWNPLERQAQLLAVASRTQQRVRLARRFLEGVCRQGRTASCQGAGWSWDRLADTVRWTTVVHRPANEYFILAQPGVWYHWGPHRVSWVPASASPGDPGALVLPGVDPALPVVWRSVVAGMRLASTDDPRWDRAKRHQRLGSLDPGRCALVLQGGLVKAAVDLEGKRVLWSDSPPEKLHKAGIFVTLVSVT